MNVNESLEHIKQQYRDWKQERDREETITDQSDIQQFLASFMLDCAAQYLDDKDNLHSFVNGLYALESEMVKDCELDRLKRIYEQIDMMEEPRRTSRLSQLMTDMEREYNIPMMNNEDFNRENIEVMELYWTISYARDI